MTAHPDSEQLAAQLRDASAAVGMVEEALSAACFPMTAAALARRTGLKVETVRAVLRGLHLRARVRKIGQRFELPENR